MGWAAGEAPDEEDLQELTAMRDEAGFHTLQLITLLVAHVWAMDHAGMHARVLMLLTQTDHALAQVRVASGLGLGIGLGLRLGLGSGIGLG